MTELSYRNDELYDKNEWERGPWDDEPDKIQWRDEGTGLPCLIVRGRMGALCGYVGVAEGHPAFEKGYDDVDVSVHGGLTYADHCADGPEEHSICHIPEPGEPDHVWWLGFDCGHFLDYVPRMAMLDKKFDKKYTESTGEESLLYPYDPDQYRTVDYVKSEVKRLAEQLHAMDS